MNIWHLNQFGEDFTKGTARKVVALLDNTGPASKRKVQWEKIEGSGPSFGTMLWSSWIRWAKGSWSPPKPDHLPVPDVSDIDLTFPTGRHTPMYSWVGDEFKVSTNPWNRLAQKLFYGQPPSSQWRGVPREGVNAANAFRAIMETLGAYRFKHEVKIASVAYMLSEWFADFYWVGDTHSTIQNLGLMPNRMSDEFTQ